MWTRRNDIDRMFDAMDLLRSRLNRAFPNFDGSLGDDRGWRIVNGSPQTNLYDTGESFLVIAEVPGISKNNLHIKIQGNYLEVSGSRTNEVPQGYKAHRVERENTSFTRSYTLPADVDADRAEASLKNGLLTLVLPKAQKVKSRQIPIG